MSRWDRLGDVGSDAAETLDRRGPGLRYVVRVQRLGINPDETPLGIAARSSLHERRRVDLEGDLGNPIDRKAGAPGMLEVEGR